MPAVSFPAPTRLAGVARRTGRALGRLDALAGMVRPWMVLGPLVGANWAVVTFVARNAVHTGRLYYNGGDGTWYYTTAWVLGHGHIPYSSIGYGYPMLLAPFARIAGPNMLVGLPYAIAVNVLVLGPIALLCVYALAKAIAGQRFAYVASTLWVVAPLLALPYFLPDYHRRYFGLSLPADLGLTTLGDFPSMVAILVAAYFGLRALRSTSDLDSLTAGLAAGLAIAVKPANAVFLLAPLLAFAVARRPRAVLAFSAALVPSVLCLALWKYRGLGTLPLFSQSAYAVGRDVAPTGSVVNFHHYLQFNWSKFMHNWDGFREFTWSQRMVMWAVLAGLVGLARRSLAFAALIGAWLASFFVLKGGSVADFYGGSYFRYMAAAFPAAFLLVMALPMLLPIAGRRLAAHGRLDTWPQTRRARRGVLYAGLFLSIAPLVPILAFPRQSEANTTTLPYAALFVPVGTFDVRAGSHGGAVTLTWPAQATGGAQVKYAVFRFETDQLSCGFPSGASILCSYPVQIAAQVGGTRYVDHPPAAGHWVYRVALITGVPPPASVGGAILLSRPAAANV